MSRVTNLILFIPPSEHVFTRLAEVNAYLERDQSRPPVSVDDPALPRGWYGGSKVLEAFLFLGAFNHLDLRRFIDHLKTLPWACSENVQLSVREQDDVRFRIIDHGDAAKQEPS